MSNSSNTKDFEIRELKENEEYYLVDKGILGWFSFIYDASKDIVTWAPLPELNFLLGKSMKEVREIEKKCSAINWILSEREFLEKRNKRIEEYNEETRRYWLKQRMISEERKNPKIHVEVPSDYINPEWKKDNNEEDWKSYILEKDRSRWNFLSREVREAFAIEAEKKVAIHKIVYDN